MAERRTVMLEEDEPLLRKHAKECKDVKEQNRYLALHALSEGYGILLVAKIFCVDEDSIGGWIKRWKEEKTLSDKPKSGRPPAFNDDEKKDLKKLIDENDPQKHGMNASFWDCAELRKYYLSRGKDISEDAIRRTLKEMGAHYVKAQFEYNEADLEKQRNFALDFLADIKKLTEKIALLFEDEMSTCTTPHKGYGWTFQKRLIIRTPQSHKERLNTFGATNPIDGRRIQMSSSIAKAPALIMFMEKVLEAYQDKEEIWIYLDNGPVHKSRLLKKWLEMHPKVKIKWMPSYSPDLNPQEQIWGYDRRKFLNNQVFTSARQLRMKLSWFVRRMKPDVVKRVASLIPIEALLSFQV